MFKRVPYLFGGEPPTLNRVQHSEPQHDLERILHLSFGRATRRPRQVAGLQPRAGPLRLGNLKQHFVCRTKISVHAEQPHKRKENVYVCVFMYAYLYTYTSIYTCTIWIRYTHVYTYIYVHIHKNVYIYICMYIYIYRRKGEGERERLILRIQSTVSPKPKNSRNPRT